jgi:uncharacterized protein (TIGR04255 family)
MEASMFDFLPAADAGELVDPPLAQVIAQVKFNSQSALSTHAGAIIFQESLLEIYPRLLSETQNVITAGPGNVSTNTIPQWRLTDLAGERSCVIGPEHVTLETTVYDTWSEMRSRLIEILNVLAEIAPPRVRERVGLRYVNHIPAAAGGTYAGRVSKTLLGLTEQDGWHNSLVASLSQVVARDKAAQLTLRYGRGAGVPGLPKDRFVVDIDVSDENPVAFDHEELTTYFDALNDCSLRCFFAAIAEPYRSTLTTRKEA